MGLRSTQSLPPSLNPAFGRHSATAAHVARINTGAPMTKRVTTAIILRIVLVGVVAVALAATAHNANAKPAPHDFVFVKHVDKSSPTL